MRGAEKRVVQVRAGIWTTGVLALGVLLACIGALAAPQQVFAAATISLVTPSADVTATGSPTSVSLFADDASTILASSSLVINGAAVPTTVDWVGHWEEDEWEESWWVVDDYTAATLSYTPATPLLPGSYEVTATINTASSGTTVHHWHFGITYPPGSAAQFLNLVPSAGGTMTVPSAITMRVQSINPLSYWKFRLYMDGGLIWTGYTGYGTNYFNATTGGINPADGPHTLRGTILDNVGVYTEQTWGITVAIPPSLSAPTPVGGSAMTNMRPAIGLNIADNSPGQMHVRMLFDGVEVFHGAANQGAFSWTPPADLLPDTSHTVYVEATDVAGNTSSTSWQFSDVELFTSPTPVPDSTLAGSPGSVSVFADSASMIMESSRILIDGTPVTTYVDWIGHYEDPDCQEYWVVDDYTAATVSAPTGVLLEGTHTVRVELQTQSEGSAVYEWDFTIDYPEGSAATFSSRSPAPGSIVTNTPPVTCVVGSPNGLAAPNLGVYVNGTKYAHSYNVYTGTSINISVPTAAITSRDGTQTIRVTALDNLGVYTENTWQISVRILPIATEPYPAGGATVGNPRQQVGLKVGDNAAGQLRLRMTVDGAVVQDGLVNQGYFRWTPPTDYANNSTHPVVAQVWDAAGNTATTSWSFNVVAEPAMSDATRCGACHDTYPGAHPFSTCDGCHRDDPLYDPHGPNRYAPLGPCGDCHGGGYHYGALVADCAYCHSNADWTQIPRHDSARIDTAHTPVANDCDDADCHPGTLVTVHAGFPIDSPFKNQCTTCHKSTVPAVVAAIAAGNTACTTCHPATDPHHITADVSELANGQHQCSTCHSASITAEHLKATSSSAAARCDACHAAGGAREQVSGAWDASCDTPGCHSAGSVRAVHENYCLACHDTAQPDFSTSKTGFPAVEDVDRDTACKACHAPGLVGAHPYHQIGSNCGSACHPGWGNSIVSATPTYVDPVSGASFAGIGSKATPAALLHTIHANPRWPGGINTSPSACSSCHAAAACGACHTGEVPATHGEHSASDQTANPAWTGLVGYGVVGGDQTQRTAFTDSNQCGSAGCHDSDASAASASRGVEDYNHAAGGNPDDPSASNSAISTTGTWRWRASNRYSGGRMSYANLSGAALTASFTGERIEIVSDKDPYRGTAAVYIDGALAGSFDAYAPTTTFQAVVFSADVAPGPHTVSVRPTGVKSASARGTFVVVDAFRVYSDLPASIVPECVSCHTDRAVTHW